MNDQHLYFQFIKHKNVCLTCILNKISLYLKYIQGDLYTVRSALLLLYKKTQYIIFSVYSLFSDLTKLNTFLHF